MARYFEILIKWGETFSHNKNNQMPKLHQVSVKSCEQAKAEVGKKMSSEFVQNSMTHKTILNKITLRSMVYLNVTTSM